MANALPMAWAALLFLLGASAGARADSALVHVVRPGETLASIADRYYGDPNRENVLVAENGLTSEGGSAIVVGLRLIIPTVSYHQIDEGESWAELAQRFYGEPKRAFALIESNQSSHREQPDPGAELLIPYPLRHVVSQGESLRGIAKDYFGSDRDGIARLRRFNSLRSHRIQRGDILLIPLANLVLSPQGRRIAEQEGALSTRHGDVREKQARISEQLPGLRELVRSGRYTEAIALANRLIGMGDLTGNQIVTIQRELGTAMVALDRIDLAQVAFERALKQQPDLELDLARTSPKVRAVFELARTQRQEQAKKQAAEQTRTGGKDKPQGGGKVDSAVPVN